jgi:hypothetical protein
LNFLFPLGSITYVKAKKKKKKEKKRKEYIADVIFGDPSNDALYFCFVFFLFAFQI